jgi:hypothetical protein
MSINSKIAPVGIDYEIDRMQAHFALKLAHLTSNSEWYPRIYPIPTEGRTTTQAPYHFESEKDYKEVFFNDEKDLTCFFLVAPQVPYDYVKGQYTRKVSMVFQANLANLYQGVLHRADEEFHMSIHNAWNLSPIKKMWKIESMETELDNVFREFDRTKINLTDMQPRHVVRFNFEVTYTPKCCTDC